jgi:hypothetical protein
MALKHTTWFLSNLSCFACWWSLGRLTCHDLVSFSNNLMDLVYLYVLSVLNLEFRHFVQVNFGQLCSRVAERSLFLSWLGNTFLSLLWSDILTGDASVNSGRL